ncbi:MAG: hypothetical protein P1R58_03280 [bacterium]|nr:hypothetical protein [bacterium]
MSEFIPTGRTSLVKANGADLQVQTEYAYRPYPRITSTISCNGKVLHKLEKKLPDPVTCLDEQEKVDLYIKKQHAVILDTIQGSPAAAVDQENAPSGSAVVDQAPSSPSVAESNLTLDEKIMAVPGTQEIYRLDMMGNFLEPGFDQKFRNSFASVYKNLREMLDIFPIDAFGKREKGVYEVDRDRLYLISLGEECYFATVRRNDGETRYEKAYKAAIASPEDLISTI